MWEPRHHEAAFGCAAWSDGQPAAKDAVDPSGGNDVNHTTEDHDNHAADNNVDHGAVPSGVPAWHPA